MKCSHNLPILNKFNIVAQLGNTEAIKEGIKAKLGISILSKCAIHDELKFGLMKYIPIKGLSFRRYFYIVQNRLRSTLPLVTAFKDFLLTTQTD